jgi:hypothetical protein
MRLDGQPLFFTHTENKEIHNKAMQLIKNQSLALLGLCWQGCVPGQHKRLRQVHTGSSKSRSGKATKKESAELSFATQRRAWKAQLSDAKKLTADSPGRLCGSLCWLPAAGRERHKFPTPVCACQPSASRLLRIGWGEGGRRPDEVCPQSSIVNLKS